MKRNGLWPSALAAACANGVSAGLWLAGWLAGHATGSV